MTELLGLPDRKAKVTFYLTGRVVIKELYFTDVTMP